MTFCYYIIIIALNDSQEGERRRFGSVVQEKAPSQQTESVIIVLHKQMVRDSDSF